MIAFVLWFALLLVICKFTRGWARGILVTLYLIGSILVAL